MLVSPKEKEAFHLSGKVMQLLEEILCAFSTPKELGKSMIKTMLPLGIKVIVSTDHKCQLIFLIEDIQFQTIVFLGPCPKFNE